MEAPMKWIVLAAAVSLFAVGFAAGSALAQEATCATKAVGKDGKPLAGAAKTAFLNKCKHDACEPKAVDKNGKPLAGAAKASFLKKCEAGA
jgi:hypothetical protein